MRLVTLLLFTVLFFGMLPEVFAQLDCEKDLDCFLNAISRDKKAQYQHEDVFFFTPASEPVVQKWSHNAKGRFSLEFGGREVMWMFIEEVIRNQSYYYSSKWKDFESTIKQEQPYLQFRLDCYCTDPDLLQQQFKVWSLGSYAFGDLTRHNCVLNLMQEDAPRISLANDLDYRLRTLSIAEQTYRGRGVSFKNYTGTTKVTLPDGREGFLQNYYTDRGEGPTARYEGTVLGIDVSSRYDRPFRLEPTMSTLEYFQTEDGTSLLQNTAAVDEQYDFPRLYFGYDFERPARRFSGNVQLESPYTQRINLHADKRPGIGQNTVQAKGELVFAFPSEDITVYRDTVVAPKATKWSEVPLQTGIECKVEWGRDQRTEQIVLRNDNLLVNYWSELKIYNLNGDLLLETSTVFRKPEVISLQAEGLIIEQTYNKVSYQRLPFSINTGIDFMIGK
ncbi:MAG: hypothetical protein AAFN81_13405 [Bacteroidota bacterium]